MTRLHLGFECREALLAATLDNAVGHSGLLIVSGGNEIRAGAFNGQARIAREIAAAGFPVFRFDRRGVGDSEGENLGYRASRQDIEAAVFAFRALAPQIERVVAFGNCDAASALMLNEGAGCDALVLSNPWAVDESEDMPHSPAEVRSRYGKKLRNPKELLRLITGGVNFAGLARGMMQAVRPATGTSSLAAEMKSGLAAFDGPVAILLASRDRTAQIFAERWDTKDMRIARCEGADHAYSTPEAHEWLRDRLLTALRGQRVK